MSYLDSDSFFYKSSLQGWFIGRPCLSIHRAQPHQGAADPVDLLEVGSAAADVAVGLGGGGGGGGGKGPPGEGAGVE